MFTMSKRMMLNLALILLPTITGCIQSLPQTVVRFQDESCRGEVHLAFENVVWDANTTELTLMVRTWKPNKKELHLFLDNESYPIYQVSTIQIRGTLLEKQSQIKVVLSMTPQPPVPSKAYIAYYATQIFAGSQMCLIDRKADELLIHLKNFKLKNDNISQTITLNGNIAVRNETESAFK